MVLTVERRVSHLTGGPILLDRLTMFQPIARISRSSLSAGFLPIGWLLQALAVMATFSIPVSQLRAEIVWSGTVGNYSDGANWVGGIAPNGNNAILIDNGGTAQASGNSGADKVTLGGSGASGTLEVLPGIASYFGVYDQFYAGFSGLGTLSIGSEALVATGDFYAGFAPGVAGIVNMNGGYLSPFTVYFGYEGNATVTMQNSSTLQSTTGYVGYLPGSQGVVNLSNSTWKAEDQGLPVDMTVGAQGNGEIQASNSQISARDLVLSSSVGSAGVVAASGGNITVQNNLQVGNAGSGNLSLTNSASISIYAGSVGVLANSTGAVQLNNSSWTSTEGVAIGLGGSGTLVADGAQFHAKDLFVGQNSGSTGSVTLSGGNMTLSGEIHVGRAGAGSFTLDGGGKLNTDKGDMGFAEAITGTMNILNGTWTNTQAIFVGVSGNGTLNIGAQGAVHSESGYIAQNAGAKGTVGVTGGSWTMSNTLVVGVSGNGEFSVTDGGAVSSQWAQIGLNAGSGGNVTVSNASWTTGQTLYIGYGSYGGSGTQFFASNGANVSAGSIELAAGAGITGSLSVVNSTLSTVNMIAGSGSASVLFSGAHLKLLGGSAVVDTLLIDGFAPGSVVVGAGGLTVDTEGGKAQITSTLSGNGTLTKTGEGRLRLTTTNTFSGGTMIEGGVIEIAGSSALGTGATTLGNGELRAIANVTLSNANPGSPPALAVGSNQTATFSATAGNTLTLAAPDFTLGSGSGVRFGSAGNTGTVVFAPDNLTISSSVSQVGVEAGSLAAGNGRLAQITAAAGSTMIAAGATLNFQDQLSGGGINALFGAGTVNTGTLSTTAFVVNSGNFSGNIAGSGGLVKETSGTLILSGQTAFIGGTTVNEGKLLVDGSLSFGFGDATVNSGGTIGGNGMMGTITLSGGTVAPGDSAGTLTAQNLFWENGEFESDLGPTQAASDLLAIGGLEGFGTTYAFTFANQGWSVGSTYTLITFDLNTIPLNDFRFTNGGGFAGDFSLTSGALQFTLTAVPEPSTWALAACAGVVACLLRVRRAFP